MGWKIFDYRCDCGNEFESMEKSADDVVNCPECGERASYVPSANLGWSNDTATKKEMLKKRSAEHTAKEQKSGNMMSAKDLPKL